MRRKNAFLDQFQKEKIFSESFAELDESADQVRDLIAEYKAATKADFPSYGLS